MILASRGAAAALLAAVMCSLFSPGAAAEAAGKGAAPVAIGEGSRIVSVGGDVTEILYALGVARHVVAVDATSQSPPEALKEKQSVGYLRALSTEGVLSMNPTLLLVSESAGPPEVVKALKSASIAYIEVPDGQSPEGVVHKVKLIANAVGARQEGERLARAIGAEFGALAEETARIRRPLRALFVLSIQNGRILVGGKGTSADAMLHLAGAENAAAEVTGFRPLSDEAIVGLAPDVIVGMRATQSGSHDLSEIFSLKGVQSTPAGAARRLVTMNGLFLLGFGPRAPAAARELMRAIYPELGGAGGPR